VLRCADDPLIFRYGGAPPLTTARPVARAGARARACFASEAGVDSQPRRGAGAAERGERDAQVGAVITPASERQGPWLTCNSSEPQPHANCSVLVDIFIHGGIGRSRGLPLAKPANACAGRQEEVKVKEASVIPSFQCNILFLHNTHHLAYHTSPSIVHASPSHSAFTNQSIFLHVRRNIVT
jgi:hypothetical protein